MPAYDYECRSCGHRFTAKQRMDEEPLSTCPECGGSLHRLISAGTGVIMRGSGSGSGGGATRCGLDSPCCGRDQPCDVPPCE
ncbi:zinc ribbon domain-containing protein [Candidatus Sumerlaeota bacterium]|nr:zinc ribbon domain-containing protein [Candidatus Sumerlaeota bacterium]